MSIHIHKNGQISACQQLASQFRCAICSQELKPKQKLPSTTELARRCKLDRKTAVRAYGELASDGLIESRPGSGTYVADFQDGFDLSDNQNLHQTSWKIADLAVNSPTHFLAIAPDAEERRDLVCEIKEATGFPTKGIGLEDCSNPGVLARAFPVTMLCRLRRVQAALPKGKACLGLRMRPTEELVGAIRPRLPVSKIALVSHWQEFLDQGLAILVSQGADPENLDTYNAGVEEWKELLAENGYSFVITDKVTAKHFPPNCPHLTFRIISDWSLQQLRHYAQTFTS